MRGYDPRLYEGMVALFVAWALVVGAVLFAILSDHGSGVDEPRRRPRERRLQVPFPPNAAGEPSGSAVTPSALGVDRRPGAPRSTR